METIQNISPKRLKPNPWTKDVGPPLSSEDYEMLKLSIRSTGIQIPLVVWRRGKNLVVLSGSNRLRIARQLRLKSVPAVVRSFPNPNDAKLFAVTDNLARRQLKTGQRAYLAYQYQQLLTVGRGQRTDLLSSKMSKVDARKSAAEKAGVSQGSLSQIKAVVESGEKGLLTGVLEGKVAVHAAAKIATLPASKRKQLLKNLNNGTALRNGSCTEKNLDLHSVLEDFWQEIKDHDFELNPLLEHVSQLLLTCESHAHAQNSKNDRKREKYQETLGDIISKAKKLQKYLK